MGKITRWFRALLAPSPSHMAATPYPHSDSKPPKRRWNFVRSYREKEHHSPTKFGDDGTVDSNNRAIAVATAAAAVAEVAIASAQAAAAVLRMTSDGRSTVNGCSSKASTAAHVSKCGVGNREEWAAVKIQSSFRAYLSRRALKALKALVKVQALVRGNIVRRKQTVAMQRRIQALLRAQARACAERRSQFFHSPHSSSKSSSLFLHPGPATPEKLDYAAIRAKSTKNHDHLLMLKRNGSKSNKTLEGLLGQQGYSYSTRTGSTDDEKSDKILEIDPGKPHYIPKQRNLFQSPHHTSLFTTSAVHQTLSSPSFEAQPFNPLDLNPHIEAANSHMRGPFTPTKSDGSRNGPNVYYDHPNYLTCTESSKAKMRSLSAPRQREGSQFERTGSTANRYSVHGELRDSCSNRQRVYGLNSDRFFASKAYPGSGSLDRLGMPVGGCDGGGAAAGFGGGHWNRY